MAPSEAEVLNLLQRSVVAVMGEEAPTVTMDAELGPDGIGIDSLDLIEIVMEIEEALEIAFESNDLDGITSIEELIAKVRSRVDETTPATAEN